MGVANPTPHGNCTHDNCGDDAVKVQRAWARIRQDEDAVLLP